MALSMNNPKTTQQRIKSIPLGLPEMLDAVSIMNKLANNSGLTANEFDLLQRMLHEYENLKHYKACNGCNVEYEIVESKINRNETA